MAEHERALDSEPFAQPDDVRGDLVERPRLERGTTRPTAAARIDEDELGVRRERREPGAQIDMVEARPTGEHDHGRALANASASVDGELRPIDIDRWVQAHPDWNGGKRTKIQAVKRALNYAVDAELIPANPLKGVKTPKNNPRVTYITASQEKAILELANPAFTLAYRVLVRTGARPGREFAALTAAHVHDNAERMEWVFAARDSKNKKPRVIRIADPEIIAIVRRQMERYPTGPIFRNSFGDPWTREALSEYFLLIRERLEAKGIQLDKDACLYSLRHSYAKRTLDGYWTGKPTSIQRLARHMGNTVQVCMDHYLQWTESQDDSLWETC